MPKFLAVLALSFITISTPLLASEGIQTERHRLNYEVVTDDLNHPWSFAFLPNGDILITELGGQLRRVDKTGKLDPQPIKGLPQIHQHGQGGLLDVVLDPDFANNHWIYFSYAESGQGGFGTAVARAILKDNGLRNLELIFRLEPKTSTHHHFGSRLVFDREGDLFITLGDRGDRPRAQDLNDHAGSLIRLHADGTIPPDNPFFGQADAKPEIYSYGHRNMQGAALHPQTGKLWIHEHGPQGGDEINIPKPGGNYGWPVITYGVNYVIGTQIGEGTHKEGMAQPVHYWAPSIAPSGMAFYTGERFSHWQGNLFVGSLKFQQLVRLELNGEKVVHEERLFTGLFGRIRDVRQGPDGLIYLLTDAVNGKLIRLLPADGS